MENDTILKKYVKLKKTKELEKIDNNLVFILFRRDFTIPELRRSGFLSNMPVIVSYWPDEKQEQLYNPNTKRIAMGAILKKVEVFNLMNSSDFLNYLYNYGITLSAFIVNKNDLIYFDKEKKEKEIQQKLEDKLNKEKEKNIQYELFLNQYQKVLYEINYLCLILVDKIINNVFWYSNSIKNGYFKIYLNAQILFVQNLIWLFFEHPRIIKLPQLNFIKTNILKYLYKIKFNDIASNYVEELKYKINQQEIKKLLQNKIYNKIYQYFNELFENEDVKNKLINRYKEWRKDISKIQKECKYNWYDEDDFLPIKTNITLPSNKDKNTNSRYLEDIFITKTKYFVYELKQLIEWYLI